MQLGGASVGHACSNLTRFRQTQTWIKLSPRRQRKQTPRRTKPQNIITYIPLRTTQRIYYGPPHRPRHSHRQNRTNPAETITNLRTPSTPRHICFAKQPCSPPRCTSRCQRPSWVFFPRCLEGRLTQLQMRFLNSSRIAQRCGKPLCSAIHVCSMWTGGLR